MFAKLKSWFRKERPTGESTSAERLKVSGSYDIAAQTTKQADKPVASKQAEEPGSEKNTAVRKKYVREETGTHESLKILDSTLLEPDDEGGMDPYNTGSFDRSKNWNNRFRK